MLPHKRSAFIRVLKSSHGVNIHSHLLSRGTALKLHISIRPNISLNAELVLGTVLVVVICLSMLERIRTLKHVQVLYH